MCYFDTKVNHKAASLMVLVMLQKYRDILDVHFSDDFPGTVKSCDILIIVMHHESI